MKKLTKSKTVKNAIKQILPAPTKKQVSTQIVVATLEKKAMPLIRQLSSVSAIKTQEQFNHVATILKNLKELARLADIEEKTITSPLNEALKATKAHFKPFKEKIETFETQFKLQMSVFLKQNKKRIEQVGIDYSSGKIKKISTYTDRVNELQVKSENAKVRKVWKVEIVDATAIPREFLIPDMVKIRQACENGEAPKGVNYIQVD